MRVLLTGGLGFIGSHCAVVLGQFDYEIVIIDNLSNSSIEILSKINAHDSIPLPFEVLAPSSK